MFKEETSKPPFFLFDFDGTIADSLQLGLSIVNELSMKYNYPPVTQENLDEFRELTVFTAFKRLQIPLYKMPLLIHEVKKSMHSRLNDLRPIKGIPEVLHKFKANRIPMAMLTSNAKDNVMPFLKTHDIDVFEWCDCDLGLFNKSRNIRKQVHKHGLNDYHCLYIGDEVRDIKAARESNIHVVSVCWGLHPKSLLCKHKPDYIIDTPEELLNLPISF